MPSELEPSFDHASCNICTVGLQLRSLCKAQALLDGGVGGWRQARPADTLLTSARLSYGLAKLAGRGEQGSRLSVEYRVLDSRWQAWFEPGQLDSARHRLQ